MNKLPPLIERNVDLPERSCRYGRPACMVSRMLFDLGPGHSFLLENLTAKELLSVRSHMSRWGKLLGVRFAGRTVVGGFRVKRIA